MAGTLKGQRGKGGGGIGVEETLVAGPLGGGNDGAGRRSEDDPNLVWNLRGRQEGARLEIDPDGTPSVRASNGGSSRSYVGVRRLTPRECERLQALPDDWTLVEWAGKPAADSRRYAAVGDAVTANVAEWIGRRLEAVGR